MLPICRGVVRVCACEDASLIARGLVLHRGVREQSAAQKSSRWLVAACDLDLCLDLCFWAKVGLWAKNCV